MAATKNGNTFLSVFIVLSLLLVGLYFTKASRYFYLSSQHITYSLGLNFNNIATQKYVDFIKSQDAEPANNPIFLNSKINTVYLPDKNQSVLGDISNVDDNKWIEIDLSEQRLYMKDHGSVVNSFLVSTGKWAPTPKGEWRIWTKLRYTLMQGGSKALRTYYYLPNVPYTMYYDRGYGIHGAYWHNNFGQPMSHGCTNMRPEDSAIVFNWASVGTRVIVHD